MTRTIQTTAQQTNKMSRRPLWLAVAATFATLAIAGCNSSTPAAQPMSQKTSGADIATAQTTAPAPSAADAATSGSISSAKDGVTPTDSIATNGMTGVAKTPATGTAKAGSTDSTPAPTVVADAQGASGKSSAQGPTGETGAQQPVMGKDGWSSHWNYNFNANSNEIVATDSSKAGAIATYLGENPTQKIGLDGSNSRRVGAVREALIAAGVPATKIQSGTFADPLQRKEARVDVLVKTS